LSADRLRALAARLSDRALALQINALGDSLADPDIQNSFASVGTATNPGDLGPRRPGQAAALRAPPAGAVQPFNGRFIGQFTQFSDPNGTSAITIILRRTGNSVSGEYSFGLGIGRITEGTVSGDTLYFAWNWSNNYGRGALRATEGGAGFDGVWGYRDSRDNAGRWVARRAE
jgi:hypothetical protein